MCRLNTCNDWTSALVFNHKASKKYIPPSLPKRSISAFVIIWQCSIRGREVDTLIPSRAASNVSKTMPFARSPTACIFYLCILAEDRDGRWFILLTTCQPSRKKRGTTEFKTFVSNLMTPLNPGLSEYGSYSWNTTDQIMCARSVICTYCCTAWPQCTCGEMRCRESKVDKWHTICKNLDTTCTKPTVATGN